MPFPQMFDDVKQVAVDVVVRGQEALRPRGRAPVDKVGIEASFNVVLPGSHAFADSLHFLGQERNAGKTPQVCERFVHEGGLPCLPVGSISAHLLGECLAPVVAAGFCAWVFEVCSRRSMAFSCFAIRWSTLSIFSSRFATRSSSPSSRSRSRRSTWRMASKTPSISSLLGFSNCSCTRFIASRAMRLRSSVPFSDPFIISMNWGVRMYTSQVSASTFSIPPRILRISSEGGKTGEKLRPDAGHVREGVRPELLESDDPGRSLCSCYRS